MYCRYYNEGFSRRWIEGVLAVAFGGEGEGEGGVFTVV